MKAKSFFYICAGVLMLATAYQLGVRRAEAQAGSSFVGISANGNDLWAITSSGDVYGRSTQLACSGSGLLFADNLAAPCDGWQLVGTVSGGPISVEKSTMGEVKGKYRDDE